MATLLVWFEPVSMPPTAWATKTPSGSTDRKPGQSCRTWPSGTYVSGQTVTPALNSHNHGNETFTLILIQRPHFQRSDGGVDTRSGGCPSQIHRYIPHSLHSQNRWHEAHHTGHWCRYQNEGTFLICVIKPLHIDKLRCIHIHGFIFPCSFIKATCGTCWISYGPVCAPHHPSWDPRCGGWLISTKC